MSKVTPAGFTFTAWTPKLRKWWPRLSETARQQVIEQFLAVKASMEAFESQMQQVADAAKVSTAALKRRIEGCKSNWIAKDDKRNATHGPPKSPFGYIVDVVASHPSPKGGYTLLIPRRVESVEDAIERLSISTTWGRGQLRYVARVLKESGEFDYWKLPSLIEMLIRCHATGGTADPHALVQFTRACRDNPPKPPATK